MEKKKILYVHGYNSSGSTGRAMVEIFGRHFPEYEVIAPSISPIYSEAKKTIEDVLETNDVALVIGTSLGGFMTLKTHNPKVSKIAINPVFDPYEDLAKIDAPKEVYESYQNKSIYNQSFNDSPLIGIFGDKDALVNYREDFRLFFPEREVIEIPEMEHQIKPSEIENILVPIMKNFI